MSTRSIGDYALLSDCRYAALVTSDGSVDWLCVPRFDSPAIFARLLDDNAGFWSIRPTAPAKVTRRYLDEPSCWRRRSVPGTEPYGLSTRSPWATAELRAMLPPLP